MTITKKSTKKPAAKNGTRIPIMTDAFKERVKMNLEKNRTYGGIGSTEEEAKEIAKELKAKGFQTLITKAAEHVWVVEKSKVSWQDV